MKLTQNYIFLQKESKNENEIVYKPSFNSLFNRLFDNIHKDEMNSTIYKAVYVKDTFDPKCLASIDIYTVKPNSYLNITVESPTKSKAIKELEEFHKQINNCRELNDSYVIIVSYDAISEYYCNKIYPKINKMERLLRRLCFNIYIFNYGNDYFTKTIDDNLQEEIKKRINNKSKKIRLQRFFYSLDFGQLETMLFVPHWTEVENDTLNSILMKENLSELSDQELRDAFVKCQPTSDWDRLFSDKMSDIDAHDLIHRVHDYRNNVAHSKFFYYKDYFECNKLLNQLIKSINKAISITEDKDFIEKNWGPFITTLKLISDVASGFVNTITPALQLFSEYTKNTIKGLTPIFEAIGEIAQTYNAIFRNEDLEDNSNTNNEDCVDLANEIPANIDNKESDEANKKE